MRMFCAVALIALIAGPAYAQTQPVQRYGESDPEKTPSQIANERKAEADYRRSIGSVPTVGPADPWGSVRVDGAKPATKAAPAKSAKSATQPAK